MRRRERARWNAPVRRGGGRRSRSEDKRSQEETPGHRRKGEQRGQRRAGWEDEDDDEEMDPQTIDSLIELSTKLHLPRTMWSASSRRGREGERKKTPS